MSLRSDFIDALRHRYEYAFAFGTLVMSMDKDH